MRGTAYPPLMVTPTSYLLPLTFYLSPLTSYLSPLTSYSYLNASTGSSRDALLAG